MKLRIGVISALILAIFVAPSQSANSAAHLRGDQIKAIRALVMHAMSTYHAPGSTFAIGFRETYAQVGLPPLRLSTV